jgi:predicted RNase H-like HicB family nuclease
VVKLLIVVEATAGGFSAYSPDVPGCIATGATREEVEQLMKAAVELHRAAGAPVPRKLNTS